MSSSDAIVVGEAWISEHYLTTDAKSQSFLAKVIERRKQWDEAAALGTVRTRFVEARVELESTLAALVEHPDGEELPALYKSLRDLLGFTRDGLVTGQEGPVTRISTTWLPAGSAR